MILPLLKKKRVFRIGSKDPPLFKHFNSFEGLGVSVSEHPEEWRIIARLGSGKVWTIRVHMVSL